VSFSGESKNVDECLQKDDIFFSKNKIIIDIRNAQICGAHLNAFLIYSDIKLDQSNLLSNLHFYAILQISEFIESLRHLKTVA
jgi:hypothetical protein